MWFKELQKDWLWLEQRLIQCKIGEVGGDQITKGYISWAREFGFYSKYDGKPLKGFEQGNVTLYIYI